MTSLDAAANAGGAAPPDSNPDGPQAWLFSYGTLQTPSVQESLFGRRLEGAEDQLEGYTLTDLQIKDPEVVATSGESSHPILVMTGQLEDRVEGTAFLLTEAELARADRYEVADYRRERVKLMSGRLAWAYVDARPATFTPDGGR